MRREQAESVIGIVIDSTRKEALQEVAAMVGEMRREYQREGTRMKMGTDEGSQEEHDADVMWDANATMFADFERRLADLMAKG